LKFPTSGRHIENVGPGTKEQGGNDAFEVRLGNPSMIRELPKRRHLGA
jgi:hypothetical protein